MTKLRVLDLFSGIGGFSLGLERTGGFETVAFCEIDPFCRRVLAKHWPEVPIYEDVRQLDASQLARDNLSPTVICGGFPCQDISAAGHRAGIDGERSGLWREFARIIGDVRPRYVIVENSLGLVGHLGRIAGDLSRIRYDAEWSPVSACSVGYPHMRKRLFVVAYPASEWGEQRGRIEFPASRDQTGDLHLRGREPEPPRVADGVPDRTHRNRGLGGAVVPEIPEMIGRAILIAEAAQ